MQSPPSQAAESFLRLANLYVRASSVATAMLEGFGLGILDEDAFSWIDEQFYATAREQTGGVRRYHDQSYNLQGLYDWELEAIGAHFPEGCRVVVTGAGAGREIIGLIDHGFEPTGYEPNESLVEGGGELLRRLGHGDRLHWAARDTYPGDAEPCDAVVVGWGSYMHIPSRARRVAFLREAGANLASGSPLLVSFHVRPERSRLFRLSATIANLIRLLRRQPKVELGDTLRPSYSHFFTRPEIEDELAAGGFRLLRFAAEPYGHAVAESV